MLIPTDIKDKRNSRREPQLWYDESYNTPSLGCALCKEISICGGLCIREKLFSCLDLCCGAPAKCDRVCRNHPDYALRVREVHSFALEAVPRASVLPAPTIPRFVPVLYHGNRRNRPFISPTVGLSLYAMFKRAEGIRRFAKHEDICKQFLIQHGSEIILSGTHRDKPLERWWSIGGPQRREIIRSFKELGIVLVTSPNYSLFTDVPRWTDLHSIKRIAITHNEFIDEGIPAALHVNGRTEMDFKRWTDYVRERPEITHLAYEFTTGTRWPGRREKHALWLRRLALNVGRPLNLVLRGGAEVLSILTPAYSNITVLDTTVFMKTMMRQRATRNGEARLTWNAEPTAAGECLDELLCHNLEVSRTSFLTNLSSSGDLKN